MIKFPYATTYMIPSRRPSHCLCACQGLTDLNGVWTNLTSISQKGLFSIIIVTHDKTTRFANSWSRTNFLSPFCPNLVSLNGSQSEKFTGFMIYIFNEFEDEESGHFIKPLPAGVSMEECHFNGTSQWVITSFGLFQGYSVLICFACLCVFVLGFWYLFAC